MNFCDQIFNRSTSFTKDLFHFSQKQKTSFSEIKSYFSRLSAMSISKKRVFSFWHVEFWPKILLNLNPPSKIFTTHLTLRSGSVFIVKWENFSANGSGCSTLTWPLDIYIAHILTT